MHIRLHTKLSHPHAPPTCILLKVSSSLMMSICFWMLVVSMSSYASA